MNAQIKDKKRLGCKVGISAVVLALIAFAMGFVARSSPAVPKTFEEVDAYPDAYPEYVETTFPVNIAPANFRIEEDGDEFVTRIVAANGSEMRIGGRDVIFPERKWREFLSNSQGGKLAYEIFVKRDGTWKKFKSYGNCISSDPIDPWIAYRLIEPGYEFGHRIFLAQRSLESFKEDVFVDNRIIATSPCVNCHSFQDRKTDRFLFHFRRNGNLIKGGTIVVEGDKIQKITAKFDAVDCSCSYPAWRPTGDLVAFSANQTRQTFHSLSTQKIEVYDIASNLALLDVSKNELIPISNTPDDFETFPSWSPDGASLYYCNAHVVLNTPLDQLETRAEEVIGRIDDFHYNIMKMDFDETTRTFGEPQVVVDAAAREKTALFPRVSPDGNFLAYTLAKSGTFPIWRPEADLYIKDLRSGEERAWTEVNSNNTESYHTWSSTGRWLVFSSRREDGQYTRLYFAHVDENGHATKPFVMPQKNPNYNRELFKSYNVPELIVEPINISKSEVLKAFKSEPRVTTNK